jgi:hypothetical protein
MIAENQHGVFTRHQAAAAGWTDSALAWSVRTDRLVRLTSGTYAAAEGMAGTSIADRRRQLVIRAVAARFSIAGGVPSHASAAAMAALPLLRMPARPCLTVPAGHTGMAKAVHLHRASLGTAGHVLERGPGVPRTASARTTVDIAREDGIDDAVVVGDAALHRGLTTALDLEAVLVDCANWPGIRRGRAAVARLDGRSESPLETISRLRILESTLPRPRLQVNIHDLSGRWLGRTDFFWEQAGVIGEADGLESTTVAAVWSCARRRCGKSCWSKPA